MNQTQRRISESIARAISYSDEYLNAGKRGIDVYILPGKKASSVNIRFMDTTSDFFIKGKNSRAYLQEEAIRTSDTTIENILTKLKNILDGSIPKPQYKEDKVLNRQTDLAKMRPEVYDKIFQESEMLTDIMDDKTAKIYTWKDKELPDSVF
ncbi:hypothetical protein HDR58_04965 [bacterium]|nr:hypothetical protein [bacterium]